MTFEHPKHRLVLAGYGPMALALLEAFHKHPLIELVGVWPWSLTEASPASSVEDEAFIEQAQHIGAVARHVGRFNNPSAQAAINQLGPDVVILATWGEILTEATLAALPCPVLNCHPALLPDYRGANPYAAVIRNNEPDTGVTLHQVNAGVDTGPILGQWSCVIQPTDTGGVLRQRCAELTGQHVPQAVVAWLAAGKPRQPQQPSGGKHSAPRLTLEDGRLDVDTLSASDCERHVRALQPWVECYLQAKSALFGQTVLLTTRQVTVVDTQQKARTPGEIVAVSSTSIMVAAAGSDNGECCRVELSRVYWGHIPVPKVVWPWCLPWLLKPGTPVP